MLRTAAQKIRAWSYRPRVTQYLSLAWRMIKLALASCVVSLVFIRFFDGGIYVSEMLPWRVDIRTCWVAIFATGIVTSTMLAFLYRTVYCFLAESFFLSAAHVGLFIALYLASTNVVFLIGCVAFCVIALLYYIEFSGFDTNETKKVPVFKLHQVVPCIAYLLFLSAFLPPVSSHSYLYEEPSTERGVLLYCHTKPAQAADATTNVHTAQQQVRTQQENRSAETPFEQTANITKRREESTKY